MAGQLSFSSIEDGRSIEVRRDEEVPDALWRKVRAEWGQVGPHPNTAIIVPVEAFASRNGWVPDACRRYGVEPVLDGDVRAVLRRSRMARKQLAAVYEGENDAEPVDLDRRLAGSRFKRPLHDFQARDAARLLALDNGANFSVPGAGKTTVELAVYESERTTGRVEQMLVVAPLSAFDAWREDAGAAFDPPPAVHRYAGGTIPPDAEILLVNYQRLASAYRTLADWIQERPTIVVLDEAHRVKKGRDGEWGSASLDLAYLAERRDVLTGTPAPQHPSDLHALFDFVWPGQATRVLPADTYLSEPTDAAVAHVGASIAPLFVRTTKRELELPEPVMQVIPVELSPLHADIYASLRAQFAELASSRLSQRDRVDLAAWGRVLMYMLEAATNPALLPAGSSGDDPIEFRHPPLPIPDDSSLRELIADYASYETPVKFIQLAKLVDEIRGDGRKVLVWSNFVRNLESLERLLAAHEPAMVHGGIPSEITQPSAPRLRERELERFRDEDSCGVLLANPAAMAEGVSLHYSCHDAIYLERTFNAGQFLQSVDRIHRLGLDPDTETRVTFLISTGTVDEVAANRIEAKATNLGRMLDDPSLSAMSLPDDDDVGQPLDVGSEADVQALFEHLRGLG